MRVGKLGAQHPEFMDLRASPLAIEVFLFGALCPFTHALKQMEIVAGSGGCVTLSMPAAC